ncbi:hypothetical protein TRFO_22010 [Tritrichomonas foetus]|uniref:Uncharacterized protein n=1 Tax=Tritrichomonas foetus TaxID=1144522 RepID=A0A1J4KH79_9EUKA|nr:hypothetical protein TRFO_22010 [Tritrichomonas foetus]|eukprot:OHT09188.1 hypothetical protein TRFO_22010 [Tritrichomonas foetus]
MNSSLVIELEELTPPKEALETIDSYDLLGYGFCGSFVGKENLVLIERNPVLYGFLQAYMEHRPITISPDIIWMLIVLAFVTHVDKNKEELRPMFVDFESKKEIMITERDHFDPFDKKEWERIVPKYISQIEKHTGKELLDTLTPDFTTTTTTTRIAGQICIMASMRHYFQYSFFFYGCGIPSVTIEGTVDDWIKIQIKLQALKKYNLEWWIEKIDPIIQEIIKTKKGDVNKSFWLRMIRYKRALQFYDPNLIDGWICNFFPYSKQKKPRHQLDVICFGSDFPAYQKVPLKMIIVMPNGTKYEIKLKMYSGFFGMEQDTKTFNLKPLIGWVIEQKEQENIPYIGEIYDVIMKQLNGNLSFFDFSSNKTDKTCSLYKYVER